MSLTKWLSNLGFALIMAYYFSSNRGQLKSTKLSYVVTLNQNSWPCVATVKTYTSLLSPPLIDVFKWEIFTRGITDLA